MKIRFLIPSTFFVSCTMVFSCSMVFADDTISIVESVDEAHCRLLGDAVCETQKHDAQKKCNKWHKAKAEKAEANTLMITDTPATQSTRPHYDGSRKKITTTFIAANYYSCDVVKNPVVVDEPSAQAPQSVEDRLLQLDALLKKELITEQEYQEKRADILKDL